MSQIQTKFIATDAVTDAKIRLRNAQYLRARNAADSADVSILRVSGTDVIEMAGPVSMVSQKITNLLDPTAAQDAATKAYVDSVTSGECHKESFTLAGGDITNQYVDLTRVAKTDSIEFAVIGGGLQHETLDYVVSYTGGAGGKTRITFAGGLATAGVSALVAADVLRIAYES